MCGAEWGDVQYSAGRCVVLGVAMCSTRRSVCSAGRCVVLGGATCDARTLGAARYSACRHGAGRIAAVAGRSGALVQLSARRTRRPGSCRRVSTWVARRSPSLTLRYDKFICSASADAARLSRSVTFSQRPSSAHLSACGASGAIRSPRAGLILMCSGRTRTCS